MNSHPRAFTLVEILVILAVIGILATLVFAMFARVREGGRRAACESNLHQIGLALQQYTGDYNGFYPLTPSDWTGKPKWSDRIHPYLKSSQVFDCPSYSEHYPDPTPANCPVDYPYSGDYRYNVWGIHNLDKPVTEAQSETLVRDPEHTSLVGDAGWFIMDLKSDSVALHYMQQVDRNPSESPFYFYSVHSGGANFVGSGLI